MTVRGSSDGGAMRGPQETVVIGLPEQVNENEFQDDDGNPKEMLARHSHAPLGESENDSVQQRHVSNGIKRSG